MIIKLVCWTVLLAFYCSSVLAEQEVSIEFNEDIEADNGTFVGNFSFKSGKYDF